MLCVYYSETARINKSSDTVLHHFNSHLLSLIRDRDKTVEDWKLISFWTRLISSLKCCLWQRQIIQIDVGSQSPLRFLKLNNDTTKLTLMKEEHERLTNARWCTGVMIWHKYLIYSLNSIHCWFLTGSEILLNTVGDVWMGLMSLLFWFIYKPCHLN